MLATSTEILSVLATHADPEVTQARSKKFGISAQNALGISHKTLDEIVKSIKKSDALAYELFDSGVYEARLVAAKILKPKNLTLDFIERCVTSFDNWEICDSYSMGPFAKSPHAFDLALDFTSREPEFQKRSGFAIIAGLTLAHNKAGDEYFAPLFGPIETQAHDDRIYVKKAISWALRSLGKRSPGLLLTAKATANRLIEQGTKSSLWIARDALREFEKIGN